MLIKRDVVGTSWGGDEYGAKKRLSLAGSFRGKVVCDVGCGAGGYSLLLARGDAKWVVAFDCDRKSLQMAKRLLKQYPNVALFEATAEHIPLKSGFADSTFLIEVLEHVNSPDETLVEAKRILRENGTLVLSAPNRFYPFETHGMKLGKVKIDNLLGVGIPFLSWLPNMLRRKIERARIYSQKSLIVLLRRHGFFELSVPRYIMPPLDKLDLNGAIVEVLRKILGSFENCPILKMFGAHVFLMGYSP